MICSHTAVVLHRESSSICGDTIDLECQNTRASRCEQGVALPYHRTGRTFSDLVSKGSADEVEDTHNEKLAVVRSFTDVTVNRYDEI